MKYLAAYLLANLSGETPDVQKISSVLSSIGVECEESQAEKVVSELAGKDLAALIAEGSSKLASVPTGPVATGGAPAAASGGAAPAAAAKEEKKEEKKEEPKEESDDDMGFGLFD